MSKATTRYLKASYISSLSPPSQTKDTGNLTYRSKKDTWLVTVIAVSGVITLAVGIMLITRGDVLNVLLGLVTVALMFGTLLWALPIGYVLDDHVLVIRTGLRRWQIRFRDIVDVQPTRDPRASPALSLDRLRVTYRKDGREAVILISPEDKDAFLEDLARSKAGLNPPAMPL